MESKEIKWASTLLKDKSITFNSVEDFKDGVLLIELLQIITDKQVPKYFKSPKNRIQSIENVNIALNFMKQNGFLFSQVSPQDLIDGSEKSIYSIVYRLYLLVNGQSKKKKYRLSLDDNKLQGNTLNINKFKQIQEDQQQQQEQSTTTPDKITYSKSTDHITNDDSDTTDEDEDNKNNSNNTSSNDNNINNSSNIINKSDFQSWKKTISISTVSALSHNNSIGNRETRFLGNNRRLTFSTLTSSSTINESTTDLLSLSTTSSTTSTPITPSSPIIDKSVTTTTTTTSGSENDITSTLSTSNINPWFSVKVGNKSDKPKNKVPLLVKISPIDLTRYDNPELLSRLLKSQQIIHCYISKRKLRVMRKFNNHRNKCFKEIITTEETYVQVVEKIVKVFYEQLLWNAKYSPTPYLTQENISTIFSTISEVYVFNKELLKRLKERESTWSSREKVGDIFVSLSHFLKVYKTYCLNYDQAIECLKNAKDKNEKFTLFIRSILDHPDNIGTQSLESLLINVVQRIPRYIMLLQDLYKHTWKDHQDYENIEKAIKMVSLVANEVNSSIKMAESQSKVLEIQKNLVGFDGELVCPSRHFIKQGSILNCKLDTNRFTKDSDEMLYFLFNDSLLLVNDLSSSDNQKHQFKYFFDLTDNMTRIKDVDDSQVIKNSFQIISGVITLIFSCTTLKDKQDLIQHIKQFQTKSSKRPLTMSLSQSITSPLSISSSSTGGGGNSSGSLLNGSSTSFGSLGSSLGGSLSPTFDDGINDFFVGGPHTVKLFKTENRKDQGKKEYTLYHISITKDSSDETITISKRYSDFDHLSKKLKKKFPDQDLKELPKKHLINSLGTSTVESRRIMLEVYLQHCFQLDSIRQSQYLINFIQSLKPQFNSEMTSDDLTRDSTRSDSYI